MTKVEEVLNSYYCTDGLDIGQVLASIETSMNDKERINELEKIIALLSRVI